VLNYKFSILIYLNYLIINVKKRVPNIFVETIIHLFHDSLNRKLKRTALI